MTKLTLTQDAYLEGAKDMALNLITADGITRPECIWGPWYTASAKDDDDNEYTIYWTILDDYDADTDEDESNACNWDEPIMVIDEDGKNLIAAGIEFEIA